MRQIVSLCFSGNFRRLGLHFCLVLLGLALAGCQEKAAENALPNLSSIDPTEPVAAQPRLPTMELWLGSEKLSAELALTIQQLRAGMMFRTNMGEGEAMLFVFGQPTRASFWMKNTLVPLSAAYIDPEGVIQEIHPLQPGNTNPVVAASERIQYVLETPEGWFKRHNVKEGMVIRTEHGSLPDTFFRRQP